MLTEISTELLIIFVLVVANGFFAGSEIAIVSVRRSRLESAAQSGSLAAKQAIALAESPDRFLATVQIGITFIGTFSAAFGGARISNLLAEWLDDVPLLAPYASSLSLLIVVLFITYLSLVIGELIPKQLALLHSERYALLAAPVMSFLSGVARPLVAILSGSVNLVFRLLGQSSDNANPVTAADIEYLVREGKASGTVEAGEAQLIHRVFRFTDRPIKAVMTPRSEIVAANTQMSLVEMAELFIESGYSRLPVYEGSLENAIGILNAKDLMRFIANPDSKVNLHHLLRPAPVVLRSDHVDDVMAHFRRTATHMALVMDEYGQVAGLVTMEDLLEELVGEIRDEYDEAEEHPIVHREDGSWLVNGLEAFDKVQEIIGLPDVPAEDREDFTTLAGLILYLLKQLPAVGETVTFDGFVLEVVDMDGKRIDKVLIRKRNE
ncbi:MAG TPA: hemolysin family protein [Chloroflexota bacterium]|nr:hemolysin family protein [Chloroflexota bacterium]HUM71084.1 hemolysin family protein [Chloroflexota bacterium]